MRWSVAMACLSVALLALAGCSGKDKGDEAEPTTTATTTSATGTSTSTSTATTANTPPTGSVSVAVNGTLAVFNLTGSDPDGDTLRWDLTFGDGEAANGTALPATLDHTFGAAGNFTANFTLSDGTESKAYNVTFAVGAGAAPAGGGTQDAVVEYTVGQAFCNGDYPEGTAGLVYGELAIEPSTHGAAFTASWEFTVPGSLGVQVVFLDAGGSNVGEVANVLVTDLTGEVPAGAVLAWFSDCGPGGPATVTYHAG